MTDLIQVTIGDFGCSEDATYCEDFGPLAKTIDGLTNNSAPATISPELAEAIRQARAFMDKLMPSYYPRYVNLADDGLKLDWEALLGEFRADYEGIKVWSHGSVEWCAEHKHNPAATVWFQIIMPKDF